MDKKKKKIKVKGNLFKIPNTFIKTKTKFLRQCNEGESEYNTTKQHKKKITSYTGWWLRVNKRALKNKSKKKKCYK